MLDKRFIINNILGFAKDNLEVATRELAGMIDEGIVPMNGQLDEMEQTIKEITIEAKQFKEFLGRVRELDAGCRSVREIVKENKVEVV